MKTTTILLFLSVFLAESCIGTKSNEEGLYGTTWELEFISESRIAFEGLFPDKKPMITFNKESGKVTGTDSCNGYSAPYKVEEHNISFGEPGPSTMMFCGGSERQFLEMMAKIDGYSLENGKLSLLVDQDPVLRFKKISP